MSMVSYVKNYRVSDDVRGDAGTAVVEMGDARRSLVISAADGEEEVTVSVTGARGGELGSLRVYRQTLRDLVNALETEKIPSDRKWEK